ncbi:MAG TPA: DotI/IcmL/TraM family protein [Gammaproteobacteria bacterium]|nr:DotI/IcmL/TraM family protein [Gammaproteobacteria bacterium]
MAQNPEQQTNPTQEKLSIISLRNAFYSDHQFYLHVFMLFLIAIIGSLALFIFYQMLSKPKPLYFHTYEENRLLETIPLEQPFLSENDLLQFTTEALISAYTYNYINYNQVIERVNKYFTPKGYQQYRNALRDSGTLQAVIQRKMVVWAEPIGAPVVLKAAPLPPRNFWTWRVELPILVTYQSADEMLRQELKVTVLITRVPTTLSTDGVMIAQIIMRELSRAL